MKDYRILARELMPPPEYIHKWIKEDKKIMYNFGIANLAITSGKYKDSKLKQKLKKSAVQNEFIDCFLNKFAKKIHIIISLKNKLIKDYFKDTMTYDNIMKELDELLWKTEPKKPFIDEEVLQKYIDKNNGCPYRGKQEYLYFTIKQAKNLGHSFKFKFKN